MFDSILGSWPVSVIRYGTAIAAVAAAVGAALGLQHALEITPVVSLMLCGILFASWAGGLGPGLLAIVLSLLAFDYFFLPPLYSFGAGYKDALRLSLFVVTGLFVLAVSTRQQSTADSLRRARDDLQAAMREVERVNASLRDENAERQRAEAELRQS